MKISFSVNFEIDGPDLLSLVRHWGTTRPNGDAHDQSGGHMEPLFRRGKDGRRLGVSDWKWQQQPPGNQLNPTGEIPSDEEFEKNWELRKKKLGIKRTA